jgi:hypothetical protein
MTLIPTFSQAFGPFGQGRRRKPKSFGGRQESRNRNIKTQFKILIVAFLDELGVCPNII